MPRGAATRHVRVTRAAIISLLVQIPLVAGLVEREIFCVSLISLH